MNPSPLTPARPPARPAPGRAWPSVVLAALGLLACVPFNIGGCSTDALTQNIGMGGGGRRGLDVGGAVQGGKQFLQNENLTEKDEDEMGKSVGIAVTSQYGLDPDPRLGRYVNFVGMTLASTSPKPDGNWVFGVLNTDQVNAFSGPNGYIMVTRGAIARMKDESELAGVLAHEMAHVLKHHGLAAVKNAGRWDAAMKVGASSSDLAARGLAFAQGGVDVITKKGYEKPQETQADKEAVHLLVSAGYNPEGYLHYIRRLSSEMGRGNNLMSTHPGLGQRSGEIAEEIRRSAPAGQGATLRERFEQFARKERSGP